MRNTNTVDIYEMCLLITKHTDHHAFFSYSGHVNGISVYITPGHTNYRDDNRPNHYLLGRPSDVIYLSWPEAQENLNELYLELEEFYHAHLQSVSTSES